MLFYVKTNILRIQSVELILLYASVLCSIWWLDGSSRVMNARLVLYRAVQGCGGLSLNYTHLWTWWTASEYSGKSPHWILQTLLQLCKSFQVFNLSSVGGRMSFAVQRWREFMFFNWTPLQPSQAVELVGALSPVNHKGLSQGWIQTSLYLQVTYYTSHIPQVMFF